MSAYSEIQTEFNDGDLLIAALTEMGFQPQNHIGKPKHLKGYHGDKRPEVADIIIPRSQVGGSSNDIGFVRGADGKFSAIISEFDSRKYGQQWINKVKVGVADAGIQQKAKKLGLKVASRKVVKGEIQYQFLKM